MDGGSLEGFEQHSELWVTVYSLHPYCHSLVIPVEEITSMLLTFPMDPDPSTVEVISDLIYSNSTTLDGRRFAAEFVSKRKADSKGSAVGSSGKTLSIADVVKTQPKPAQNEWGGFKVVNKKKKGARA